MCQQQQYAQQHSLENDTESLSKDTLTQGCRGLLLDRELDGRSGPVSEPRWSGIPSVLRGALPVWGVEAGGGGREGRGSAMLWREGTDWEINGSLKKTRLCAELGSVSPVPECRAEMSEAPLTRLESAFG